ncbi:hypothetical protein JAAARDRAFT_554097 [Jaapia argillacea MUCL 33604]|uniref:Cyclic-AMP phosphodiesterase n=1 Tax=Jaapia argillacea MUCL 33604 TaxID=933084 RepID=A0A067Q334_9AGAM|nr:hypothetical protein JAAARDRAFT_554097 [Jaapia argillacea MUCL 33604]
MPTFTMVVLGSGGGPHESNMSGYLIKPSERSWTEGIIGVEAGSGLGALDLILERNPSIFDEESSEEPDSTDIQSAYDVYSSIRCFLVTHAHLDHVNGLILSAGSIGGPRKRIYAAHQTLKDIDSIFGGGRIWPNLASWKEQDDAYKLLYQALPYEPIYTSVGLDVSVRMMPLSHGFDEESGIYDSAAFFIKHDPSGREFLFFGDVEPDSISTRPQTIHVWRAAAAKIPHTLDAIFIECSWPSGRSDATLYGHLNPEHLVAELVILAKEVTQARQRGSSDAAATNGHSSNGRNGHGSKRVRKKQRLNSISEESLRGALAGVRVFITHCKADLEKAHTRPINHVIAEQVRVLADERGLGADIVAVDQGLLLDI